MARMAHSFSSVPVRQRAAGLLYALLIACGPALAQPAAVGTAAVGTAPAAADAPAPLSKGEIKARRDFQLLDFNHDGKLSRSEVALFPRLAAAFDTADTDKDGFVSFEEVEVFTRHYRAERAARAAAEQEKK